MSSLGSQSNQKTPTNGLTFGKALAVCAGLGLAFAANSAGGGNTRFSRRLESRFALPSTVATHRPPLILPSKTKVPYTTLCGNQMTQSSKKGCGTAYAVAEKMRRRPDQPPLSPCG